MVECVDGGTGEELLITDACKVLYQSHKQSSVLKRF